MFTRGEWESTGPSSVGLVGIVRNERVPVGRRLRSRTTAETTQEADARAEALWRIAAARLLVRRGSAEDAVRLAQEAMDILRPTQETFTLSTLLLDAADVLRLAGRQEDEAAVLREAVRVSERKAATVLVRRAQERLSQLAPSPGRSNV